MNRFAQQVALSAVVAAVFAGSSLAAPVKGSAYDTDPQESHVFDQTSEPINTVNMITCVIDAMKPADMVNAGDYVALVGLKRCDSSNRSSASNSGSNSNGSSATQLARAIVNSSRTSTNSPMRVKAWIEEEEEGSSRDIFVNVSANEAPSNSNPYGDFRLDFCGVAPNQSGCMMQGFLSGSSTGLRFAETEQGGSRTRQVYLTKSGPDSGAGAVQVRDVERVRPRQVFAVGKQHDRGRREVPDIGREQRLGVRVLRQRNVLARDRAQRGEHPLAQRRTALHREAVEACRKSPPLAARGIPRAGQTLDWTRTQSITLSAGNRSVDVGLWQVDHPLWNARYRNPYLVLTPADPHAGLVCKFDVLSGEAGLELI